MTSRSTGGAGTTRRRIAKDLSGLDLRGWPMVEDERLSDPVAEDMVNWMVELTSGDMSQAQRDAFEAWLAEDPDREQAFSRLQGGLSSLGHAVQRPLVRDLLDRRQVMRARKRRTILTGLVGIACAGTAGLALGERFVPLEEMLEEMLADRVTLTAQRKRIELADGSVLTLGPRSALDLGAPGFGRGAVLREGQVLAAIAPASVPFTLATKGAELRSSSGRLLLERRGERVEATAIDTAAAFESRYSGRRQLEAGHGVVLTSKRLHGLTVNIDEATAWLDDLLVVRDRTVAEVIEGLRPYFAGAIRYAPEVAELRVSGAFRLDDPTAAIRTLGSSLGLKISTIAGYWVMVGPGPA